MTCIVPPPNLSRLSIPYWYRYGKGNQNEMKLFQVSIQGRNSDKAANPAASYGLMEHVQGY